MQSVFEEPLSLEIALERNEKNGNVETKPKLLPESIFVEQGDNQIKLNPLSHVDPNGLNISQISGSSKTFSSLSYDSSSNMFTTEVEKETELLLEKNVLKKISKERWKMFTSTRMDKSFLKKVGYCK